MKTKIYTKFKVGDSVLIRVCNLVGMVISVQVFQFSSYEEIKFMVAYPDRDGIPCRFDFSEIELELVENTEKVGFNKN